MRQTSTHSGKPPVRLLLFSDLLLDRPYEWAPPAVAAARRAAAREALVALLGTARERQVDVIACAGNLFDRRTVAPVTMQWLIAALRSARTQVLVAPGSRDFVGPLGGYSCHFWPENVTVFETDRLAPVEVADGVTVWGAAHTEAHRARSFLDRLEVDRDGVNLALFQGAERVGFEREPDLEQCAPFDEQAIEAAGFDHALVGHYHQPHFGRLHTYPGAAIAHEPGRLATGGAVLVTLLSDGTVDREHIELASPALHEVEVDLTGVRSVRDALKRTGAALDGCSGVVRLRLTGSVSPDIVLQREDLVGLAPTVDDLLLDWRVDIDIDLDDLADEQTVRGQFVRDVLGASNLSEESRQRVLLIGLRALAGSDVLEGPR
jgi:DNA repair exonuclease SbcCD nuclease subunit